MLSSLETIVLKATNDVDVSLTRPFNLVAGRRYELSVKSRQRELLEDSRVGFVARRRGGDFDTLGQHQVTQAYEYYDATLPDGNLGTRGYTVVECVNRYPHPGGIFPGIKAPIGWLRGHVGSYFEYLKSVATKTEFAPSFDSGAYVQCVLESAYKSNESGTWEKVEI